MRIYITIAFICLLQIKIYSQNVSVELSITWKKVKNNLAIDPLTLDSLLLIPVLDIIYKNYTDKDIYFKKVVAANEYPSIASLISINTRMSLEDQVKVHGNYSGEDYRIVIGNSPYCHFSWMLSQYVLDSLMSEDSDFASYDLSNINQVLEVQSFLDKHHPNKRLSCFSGSDKQVITFSEANLLNLSKMMEEKKGIGIRDHFEKKDITKRNISSKLSNQFIFLRKREEYIESVNLLSFYIVGGNFTFLIENHKLDNYVLGDSFFNKKVNAWESQKINLPGKVGEYSLYVGYFLTNTVDLKVEHQKIN